MGLKLFLDIFNYKVYTRDTHRKANIMQVQNIGSNMIQVVKNNGTFLVSYSTVVAAQLSPGGFVRTSKKWSVTTSKHINKWLEGAKAGDIDQKDLQKAFDQ